MSRNCENCIHSDVFEEPIHEDGTEILRRCLIELPPYLSHLKTDANNIVDDNDYCDLWASDLDNR